MILYSSTRRVMCRFIVYNMAIGGAWIVSAHAFRFQRAVLCCTSASEASQDRRICASQRHTIGRFTDKVHYMYSRVVAVALEGHFVHVEYRSSINCPQH